jgi:hypothetical protein
MQRQKNDLAMRSHGEDCLSLSMVAVADGESTSLLENNHESGMTYKDEWRSRWFIRRRTHESSYQWRADMRLPSGQDARACYTRVVRA